MKKSVSSIRVEKRFSISMLLFFFSLFFASDSLAAQVYFNNQDEGREIQSYASISFSAHYVPLQSPEEPLPVSEEKQEKTNEKDSDEYNELIRSDIHSGTYLISGCSSGRNNLQSLLNREKISLFILYHSWKSFLI